MYSCLLENWGVQAVLYLDPSYLRLNVHTTDCLLGVCGGGAGDRDRDQPQPE